MSILPRLTAHGAAVVAGDVRAECGGPFATPLVGSPETCQVCAGPRSRGFATCFPCARAREAFGDQLADVVVPLTYAVSTQAGARLMRLYKDDAPPYSRRILGRLLRLALHLHGGCIEHTLGQSVSAWAFVPSTRSTRPDPHPPRALGRSAGLSAPETRMAADRVDDDSRRIHPERFRVDGDVVGRTVLLLEDTWVTGGRAQSATVAVRRAGADRVAVLVLARWLDMKHETTADFVHRHVRGDYEPTTCPLACCSS